MKIRCVVAAVALVSAGGVACGDDAVKSQEVQAQEAKKPNPGEKVEQAASSPLAKVAPSDRAPPNGGADGRVSVGGITISRARFGVPSGSNAAQASRQDGLIDVPSNTLGPGESLQQRNDLIAADNRRALAEASIAEREATRPVPRNDERNTFISFGHGTRGVWYGGGFGGGWDGRTDAWNRPRGPITTQTIGFENEANGRALKHYSDAAAAAIIDAGGLQREAVLNFGKASTPPLIEQQNQRDQAQINLRKPPQPAGK